MKEHDFKICRAMSKATLSLKHHEHILLIVNALTVSI